jgi:hypothetical protein
LVHVGKGVVAWKEGGEQFISQGSAFFSGNNSYYVLTYGTDLTIRGLAEKYRARLYVERIFLEADTPIILNKVYDCHGSLGYENGTGIVYPKTGNSYKTDSLHKGTLIINYYDGNIIAGRFQMNMVSNSGEEIHVTEGQFDLAQ